MYCPLECTLKWNERTRAQLHVTTCNNEQDNINKSWIIHKANGQDEALKIKNKLESLEIKLNSLIEKEVEEVLKVKIFKTDVAK